MSPNAIHAVLTLVLGVAVGALWLRVFWRDPARAPAAVLAAPAIVALLGLGHWVAYDFSFSHWPGGFSLAQALFNVAVAAVLLVRRASRPAPGAAA